MKGINFGVEKIRLEIPEIDFYPIKLRLKLDLKSSFNIIDIIKI